MTAENSDNATLGDWPEADRGHLAGATMSAQVSASVGEIVAVYSRAAILKHYALADIEWLVLPPVLIGQFHVVRVSQKEDDFRAPIAVATWAFVSQQVDQRLSSDISRRIRLHPYEWKSGEIAWIVDLAGEPGGVTALIAWLRAGPFRHGNAKLIMRNLRGQARVTTLNDLAVSSLRDANTQ